MKVRLNKTILRAMGAVTASSIILISFQNCGKAGFDSSLDAKLSSEAVGAALATKYGSEVGAKVAAIPFAFDGGFDQIAYNSCADASQIGSPGFFSIKAGAYENMGLKINSDFFNYVTEANGFKPNYPETTISHSRLIGYLADSPANKGVFPNAAIRQSAKPFIAYGPNGSPTLGVDAIKLVSDLTSPLVADTIIDPSSAYTHYFPFSPEVRTVEATFNYNKDLSTEASFRHLLVGDGTLTFSYLQSSTAVDPILSPGVGKAYGKGYHFQFISGVGNIRAQANVLINIQEVNLQNPTGVQWSCNRIYKVYRVDDVIANPGLCPALTDNDMANPNTRRELEIARRQLRGDQWDINPNYRCVVPKNGISCYNETPITRPATGVIAIQGVEYDSARPCFSDLLDAQDPQNVKATPVNLTDPPGKRCANFISICTRGF